MEKTFAIAIDGPVGVGKSTTAYMVAEKLGFTYIDSGAMYRAVAYYMAANGIDINNQNTVCNVLEEIDICFDSNQNVYVNGINVTENIRTQEISQLTSVIAPYAKVREKLVKMQREMADSANIVMDGRDIASFVLPNADLKIYLDADIEIRAKRRFDDLIAKGQAADFETVRTETITRDKRDMTREQSPLVRTADAVYVDTGNKTIDEVVFYIIDLFRAVQL